MSELVDAAMGGLEVFAGEGEGEKQEALVPSVKVKFNGLQYDSIEKLPELKESLRFEVEGYVVGHGQVVMANGEIRDTATVKVTNVNQVTD